MTLYSPNTLIVVLVLLGLVIPTGAVMHEDEVWDTPEVVLTPHDGPNGERYAGVCSSGNLSIDLETVGLNPNALTSIRDVFDVNNRAEEDLRVWVTHGSTDVVRFEVDGEGLIQGEKHNVTLGPGESRAVSLLIDTEGAGPSEEPLLTTFQLHVAPVQEEPAAPTPTTPAPTLADRRTPTPTPAPTPEPTPEPTPTPGPPVEQFEDVEVEFDEPTDEGVRVRDVPVEEILADETDEDDARPPRAVIDVTRGTQAGEDRPARDRPEPGARGDQAVVEVNQEATLSGAQSVGGRFVASTGTAVSSKPPTSTFPKGRRPPPRRSVCG